MSERRRPPPRRPEKGSARPAPRGAGAASAPGGRRPAQAAPPRPPAPGPSVAISALRGLQAVGSSPALLATAFVGVLAVWLIDSSTSSLAPVSPRVMAQLVSLAPIHSIFDGAFVASAARLLGGGTALGLAVALFAVRAALAVMLFGLAASWLRGDRRASAAGRVVRTGLPRLPVVAGLEVGSVVVTMLVLNFGLIGVVVIVAVAYYLIYAPVVAVLEGTGLGASLRLAVRTARLPGGGHLLLVFPYLSLTIALIVFTPFGVVAPATPSIAVWLYVLFMTLLHTVAAAALTHRWLAVREDVLAADAAASQRGSRTQGRRSLFGRARA